MFQNMLLAVTLTQAVMRGYLAQNEPIRAYLCNLASEDGWEDLCALYR